MTRAAPQPWPPEVTWWCGGACEVRHKTKNAALNCDRRRMRSRHQLEIERGQRRRKIINLKKSHWTVPDIARELGCSDTTVRKVWREYQAGEPRWPVAARSLD